jgi:hypothetical protein
VATLCMAHADKHLAVDDGCTNTAEHSTAQHTSHHQAAGQPVLSHCNKKRSLVTSAGVSKAA